MQSVLAEHVVVLAWVTRESPNRIAPEDSPRPGMLLKVASAGKLNYTCVDRQGHRGRGFMRVLRVVVDRSRLLLGRN